MSIKQKFVDLAVKQNGKGYVWATNGEVMTQSRLDKLRESYYDHINPYYDHIKRNYIGKQCFDCSGLVYWLLNQCQIKASDATANTLYVDRCFHIERNQLQAGDLCFRHNGTKIVHVGVYVGDNQILEAKGTKYGVVISHINDATWTHYGKLNCFAEYEEIKNTPKSEYYSVDVSRYLNFRGEPINGKYGDIIGKLVKGDIVKYEGEEKRVKYVDWYKVSHNGLTGWAAASYLEPVNTPIEPSEPITSDCEGLQAEYTQALETIKQLQVEIAELEDIINQINELSDR